MPRRGDLSRICSDCHFKTVGNSASPVDEDDCSFRRKDFARSLLEKVEPAVEMFVPQSQFQMRGHGAAIVIAGLEDDRRPERGDLRDVVIPIIDRIGKDRPDNCIFARASIERRHQSFD